MAHKSPHMLWSAKTKSPVFERSLLTLHSVPICIRGEGLRVSESLQCDDPSECYAVGVQPSGYSGLEFPVRGSYAGVTDCTSSQSKTHNIESQEVRYRWIPGIGWRSSRRTSSETTRLALAAPICAALWRNVVCATSAVSRESSY